MSDAILTITGRLVAEPQLRFIPSGDAVASFTVAQNERKLDKATGQWVDGEAMFIKVEAWRQLAEGAAERLEKGSLVTVTGNLKPDNYTKDGVERKGFKLVAKDIGASVRAKRQSSQPQQQLQEADW